jgi:MoxR-like ATPase
MMIALSHKAARDNFATATGVPPQGSRVCISGFPKHEHEEAAQLLSLHGLQPTAFVNGADAVLVPERTSAIVDEASRGGRRVLVLADLLGDRKPPARRVAFELTADSVRILDVTLPRRGPGGSRVPPQERFSHLCLDGGFLEAARTVAVAAAAGLPCGLEGETAVSKTTVVLWLAHLCRQDAVRLNLNGQSDTGELVGRFVPATEENRSWRFWEGVVPAAMRNGWWVVLDELNLAEPQVLERLNPVLEQPPSLVLSEHDGLQFGPGGDVPVADSFRVFATMNPAEYAGRSVLSPAFRDRFGLWSFLEPPSEADYRALLHRLVHGAQPEFTFQAMTWQAPDAEPVYPALAKEKDIDRVLDSLATFHSAVISAAGGDGTAELGRGRRERYVFTRRTLLNTVALLADRVARGDQAASAASNVLELTYLKRIAPGPDRQAVLSALRAVEMA